MGSLIRNSSEIDIILLKFVFYGLGVDDEASISKRYQLISDILKERQCRLYLAAEVQVLGHNRISLVSRATHISRPVIHADLKELVELDLSSGLQDGRVLDVWVVDREEQS